MSIIKSIKQVLGLGPAAENHFWDGSVPNQLTLKRGTPDAPGTELLKALNGVLSFPNQGQLLAPNGYVKLPGGLIVQWGFSATDANGVITWVFPMPFPNELLRVMAMPHNGNSTIGNFSSGTSTQTSFNVVNAQTDALQVAGIPVNLLVLGY